MSEEVISQNTYLSRFRLISGDCLMGNADEVKTPKGLFATGDVGLHRSFLIGIYKGGRNETFMYAAEDKTN